MRAIQHILVIGFVCPALSWLSQKSVSRTGVRLSLSTETPEVPDYTGKTIYQRTFYRLSPGSQVSKPNSLLLEERLRFKADPDNEGYILPYGPRTFIFREGTNEDEITEELFRMDLGTKSHNGPGTMDTAIATVLYLSSNPEIVQGDVLQLGCEDGSAGVLGCVGAKFSEDPNYEFKDAGEMLPAAKHGEVFPKRMKHLTLSDEDEGSLKAAFDTAQHFSNSQLSLNEIRWANRIPGRRYNQYYRLIVGSDMDFSYPSSKELARTVANYLLPSNEFAAVQSRGGAGGSSGGSFGGLGMDMESSSPAAAEKEDDPEREVDPKVPPTFVHVCPDTREDVNYLRQFLEKGFKMTVNSSYLKLVRLQFVFQTLPDEAPEDDIEDLDLELKDESSRSYQSLTAIHHPDYAGEGTGEYFFPLETGEYEGGKKNTYLELEEGGSPW